MRFIKHCFIFMVAFSSCNTKEERILKSHIDFIHQINNNIPNKEWMIDVFSYPVWEDDYKEFLVSKTYTDTTYILKFGKYDTVSDFRFVYFERRFKHDDRKYYLTTNLHSDTLLLYYHAVNDSLNPQFEVGKYRYLAQNGGLSDEQLMFFNLYSDSLTRIKGNKLPDLPEISDTINYDSLWKCLNFK